MLAPSGHNYTSVYDIVLSHLTDHPISDIAINSNDNIDIMEILNVFQIKNLICIK